MAKYGSTDKTAIGIFLLVALFNIAWIGVLIWAIIKVVTHFT